MNWLLEIEVKFYECIINIHLSLDHTCIQRIHNYFAFCVSTINIYLLVLMLNILLIAHNRRHSFGSNISIIHHVSSCAAIWFELGPVSDLFLRKSWEKLNKVIHDHFIPLKNTKPQEIEINQNNSTHQIQNCWWLFSLIKCSKLLPIYFIDSKLPCWQYSM